MQQEPEERAGLKVSREGTVAVLELNRPEYLNAIDIELRRGLLDTLVELGRDPDTTAIVLTGVGRAFCAGADLKGGSMGRDPSLRSAARVLVHDFQPLVEAICKLDKPVIAAINGAAVGVGMSVALACDLVLMADDAYMATSAVQVGLVPDGGLAWFLCRQLGYQRTFELLTEGSRLEAARCLEIGLANTLVAAEELRACALERAAIYAERAPMTLALTKRLARLAQGAGLADTMAIEAEMQALCMATEDSREAMAAFAEKRKPTFSGR